jgi:hypothetical protein
MRRPKVPQPITVIGRPAISSAMATLILQFLSQEKPASAKRKLAFLVFRDAILDRTQSSTGVADPRDMKRGIS